MTFVDRPQNCRDGPTSPGCVHRSRESFSRLPNMSSDGLSRKADVPHCGLFILFSSAHVHIFLRTPILP